ncbi:MAG: LamB/YcsF family protein [Ilumatobacteraceae bacterium]
MSTRLTATSPYGDRDVHIASHAHVCVVSIACERQLTAVDGTVVAIEARSICIHGDTPGAVQLASAVRRALQDAAVRVHPFVI